MVSYLVYVYRGCGSGGITLVPGGYDVAAVPELPVPPVVFVILKQPEMKVHSSVSDVLKRREERKLFGVEYTHKGMLYGIEVPADNEADARQVVNSIAETGRIVGQLMEVIPLTPKGWVPYIKDKSLFIIAFLLLMMGLSLAA